MLEDLRGIEGLFEKLCVEADESAHVKYKELGTTSDYKNGAHQADDKDKNGDKDKNLEDKDKSPQSV